MKPEAYAHALHQLVSAGMAPKEAVEKISAVLEARGRSKLMPQVARAFERLAERTARKSRDVLVVAHAKDADAARAAAGAPNAHIVTDHTLIGGWRHEQGSSLRDASWKARLLSMYTAVIN